MNEAARAGALWHRRLLWGHGPHRTSSLLGAISAQDIESVTRAVAIGSDPLARGGEALALANRVVSQSRSAAARCVLGWLLDISRRRGISGGGVLAMPAFALRPTPSPRYRGRDGKVLTSIQSRRIHALKRERLAKLSSPFFATFHEHDVAETSGPIGEGILLIAEALR